MIINSEVWDVLEKQSNFHDLLELHDNISNMTNAPKDIWEDDGKLKINKINIKSITENLTYTNSDVKTFNDLKQLNELGVFDD